MDDNALGDLFGAEPERPATPPPSVVTHRMLDGSELQVQLVGGHSLWGHVLYPSARQLAQYLERHPGVVRGKRVVELGAGGGCPGLVAARLGAALTVISDYNDAALVANIAHNIAVNCIGLPGRTLAVGQTWGYDPSALLDAHDGSASGYDLVLLADVVFNHSQHAALLATCEAVLAPGGQVLCFYSHHRPWLVEADERLFAVAEGRGWTCERIWKDEKAGVAFPEDGGDPGVRGTVHGWRLHRSSS